MFYRKNRRRWNTMCTYAWLFLFYCCSASDWKVGSLQWLKLLCSFVPILFMNNIWPSDRDVHWIAFRMLIRIRKMPKQQCKTLRTTKLQTNFKTISYDTVKRIFIDEKVKKLTKFKYLPYIIQLNYIERMDESILWLKLSSKITAKGSISSQFGLYTNGIFFWMNHIELFFDKLPKTFSHLRCENRYFPDS